MEYINAVIGGIEMYIPTNDKLGEMIFTANKRLNFCKQIAKMRKAHQGKIENKVVVVDSDFFYALEDVMTEKGYDGVIHHLIERCPKERAKVLYALFREDKTMRYLIAVCGYGQEQVQDIIHSFFETLKKSIY
jgi:hypothetical protein